MADRPTPDARRARVALSDCASGSPPQASVRREIPGQVSPHRCLPSGGLSCDEPTLAFYLGENLHSFHPPSLVAFDEPTGVGLINVRQTQTTMQLVRLLFPFLFAVSSLAGAEAQRESAESVATQYMEAFFRSDIEVAAGLLSPAVLDPFKKIALAQIEAAGREEQLQVLTALGYSSIENVRKAASREVFVKITKLQRAGTPDAVKRAQAATVVIEKVEHVDPDRQRFTLRIRIPNTQDQVSGVVVQRIEDHWMVVGI